MRLGVSVTLLACMVTACGTHVPSSHAGATVTPPAAESPCDRVPKQTVEAAAAEQVEVVTGLRQGGNSVCAIYGLQPRTALAVLRLSAAPNSSFAALIHGLGSMGVQPVATDEYWAPSLHEGLRYQQGYSEIAEIYSGSPDARRRLAHALLATSPGP